MNACIRRTDRSIASKITSRSIIAVGLMLTLSMQTVAAPPIPVAATGRNGMVVSGSAPATQAGVDVLKRGGNAVDAAVAVAVALAVTWPEAGNLGGGGFMMIHPVDGRRPVCVEYRETAPRAATA